MTRRRYDWPLMAAVFAAAGTVALVAWLVLVDPARDPEPAPTPPPVNANLTPGVYAAECPPTYTTAGGAIRPNPRDGDTVHLVLIDSQRNLSWRFPVRVDAVDAPEVGEPGWMEARDLLSEMLGCSTPDVELVAADVRAVDSFGRPLADLTVEPVGDVGEALVRCGPCETAVYEGSGT